MDVVHPRGIWNFWLNVLSFEPLWMLRVTWMMEFVILAVTKKIILFCCESIRCTETVYVKHLEVSIKGTITLQETAIGVQSGIPFSRFYDMRVTLSPCGLWRHARLINIDWYLQHFTRGQEGHKIPSCLPFLCSLF